LDLNTPVVLTTVCGMSSRLVHVTVVPVVTVKSSGPNLKLSIFTATAAGATCCAEAASSPLANTGLPFANNCPSQRSHTHTYLHLILLQQNKFFVRNSRNETSSSSSCRTRTCRPQRRAIHRPPRSRDCLYTEMHFGDAQADRAVDPQGTFIGPGASAFPGAGCGNAVEHAV